MQDLVQVKMESADEKGRQIMTLCLEQCESPNDRNLLRIGSYLGDFANNLRSALNYTMRHFVDTQLKPVLSPGEYKDIERKQDFPCADSKAKFDERPIITPTRKHCISIYNFLEGVQPYFPGNEWLRHLMTISNTDKHVIINEIKEPTAITVAFMKPNDMPHHAPDFFGPDLDRILVGSTPKPHVHLCPCYYYPFGGFAIKGGKWAFFLISLDECHLGLTRFIERVPQSVKHLIDDFNALV